MIIKLKDLLTENLDSEIEVLKKYMSPGGERSVEIDDVIKSLHAKKSKYKKELEPIKGEVYRGTAYFKKDLKNLKLVKRDGRWLYLKISYNSKRSVQSFTHKEEVADKFADLNAVSMYDTRVKGDISGVFITKVDNSFVGNYKWLAKIGKEVGLKRNEQEVFHVGKKMNGVVKVDAMQLYGMWWKKELGIA